ncbi:ATP-binding protein [Streptomyces sp. NPDC002004]
MKQSAVKTLGVAALGAAFAAAGAGAANAAPAIPDANAALGGVAQTLPVDGVARVLPEGATTSLAHGQEALANGRSTLDTTVHAVQPTLAHAAPQLGSVADGKGVASTKGLLGGLPATQGLGTKGLPLNGIPLA